MVINQKMLRKGLAFSVLGLYAFGVGLNFHFKTKCEYITYLTRSVEKMRATYVLQNEVLEQYNSLDADTSVSINDHGDAVIPYITYSISHNANNYYTVGEVHFCLVDKRTLDQEYNNVYLTYDSYYADYSISFTDVGDFQYNNVYYNIIEFLTTLSADNVYSYNIVYQYGYTGVIDYDYTNQRFTVELNFVFKEPSSSSWTSCNLYNLTRTGVTYLSENLHYTFNNYSYLNTVLSANLNYSKNNTSAYQNGVNDVLNNPSAYGLYTLNEYLTYGTSKYNEGLEDGSNVLSLSGVMNSIFSAPITMFMGIFNSAPFTWTMPTGEILDIGGIMTFFLTIGIALAIVRLIMRVGGK